MNRTVCDAIIECVDDPYRLFRDVVALFAPRRPFLLESLDPGSHLSRWSFIGANPFLALHADGTTIVETDFRSEGAVVRSKSNERPLDALNARLDRFRAERAESVPSPFQGGAVGALAYDMGRLIEPVPLDAARDVATPDLDVAFYDAVAAHDRATRRLYLLRTEAPNTQPPDWFAFAANGAARSVRRRERAQRTAVAQPPLCDSTMSRDAYRKAVNRAQEYIAAGDIYQINVTQRFSAPWPTPPMALYSNLRRRNPAPFSAFVELDDATLLSSSPERFLRYEPSSRRIETRPIKGTRPRGDTETATDDRVNELLASEKEAAELVMIVDLERNDLGRVCDYGTVRVPALREVERYASVIHTAATVEGRVSRDKTLADVLRATFPGGSITGAPKIRAMQIIDELEPVSRGFYTGAIGYFGFDGNVDLNIAIRTFVLKDGVAYFGVGSGIVADSDPIAEYEETMHKARSLFDALSCR